MVIKTSTPSIRIMLKSIVKMSQNLERKTKVSLISCTLLFGEMHSGMKNRLNFLFPFPFYRKGKNGILNLFLGFLDTFFGGLSHCVLKHPKVHKQSVLLFWHHKKKKKRPTKEQEAAKKAIFLSKSVLCF
jgi:hypothetical protein